MENIRIAIEGMACEHCVSAVAKALRALDGVEVRNVAVGSATVAFDPERVTIARILEAIADDGYVAELAPQTSAS